MVKSALATKVVDFGTAKSNPRTEKVSKITIHHMAGQIDAEACARMHRDGNREASANYYIGPDGTICAGVSEDRRAWTSSSSWNDQRAITIECSNCGGDPDWPINNATYQSLIRLCADICKRYNIVPAYTGHTDATITVHLMYAATACPGPWIMARLQNWQIQNDIKKAMGTQPAPQPTPSKKLYRVQVGAFKKKGNADKLAEELKSKGYDVYIKKVGDFYKVQVGAFSKKENAQAMYDRLVADGYKPFIAEEG